MVRRQPRFGQVRQFHLVGIGGIGMSAIAEVLLHRGYQVSGSDSRASEITEGLTERGAQIFIGHAPENIQGADVVIHTSAVRRQENIETRAAIEARIPVIKRAEMLAELMRTKFSVGIAGTHGKTTTTTMAAQVIQAGDFDPTAIVGGRVESFARSNALIGDGDLIVVEADEFDRTFLKLPSSIAVITNIEIEHVDIYDDLDDLKGAFLQFARAVPFYGALILCVDDPHARSLLDHLDRPVLTYGFSPQARLRAQALRSQGFLSRFEVLLDHQTLGEITLRAPGAHNACNALAAIGVGLELGIPFEQIQKGISNFSGILRRFHLQGEEQGILLIDDYAHHPTEVEATLKAARTSFPGRRLVAAFQPHLYSRTRQFHAQFAAALSLADLVFVTDVYPAREAPLPGVTGDLIAEAIEDTTVHYLPEKEDLPEALLAHTTTGDLVITLGAGDINALGARFLETLS